jgi:hypothetical protein
MQNVKKYAIVALVALAAIWASNKFAPVAKLVGKA